MDLDGLFWIALIVFYFVARVLGSKRKQADRSPQPARPPRERVERQREDDLDAALGEIRRALGFPDGEPEVSDREEPAPSSDVSRRQQLAREQAEVRRRRAAREQAAREQAEVRRRHAAREQAAREHDEMRRRYAAQEREAAHERKRKAREQPPERTIAAEARVGRQVVRDLPPLRSTFAEEEKFERMGRHGHRKARHDLQIVSPYDVPARKKLRGINRRLTGRASLREAFLLKEILDRPLAMRRR